jgi:dephospho-CoA kinase
VSALAIGLTGGIGCGKSTVAAPRGAVAREFGGRFVTAEGALDRGAMRELVFADSGARARLEAILHPAIRAEGERLVDAAAAPYAMVGVPLLFETGGWLTRVRATLVVDCDEELQVLRASARPGMSAERVRSVMRAQWPRWRRLQLADDVVWNGGTLEALTPQCERLHSKYTRLARDGS